MERDKTSFFSPNYFISDPYLISVGLFFFLVVPLFCVYLGINFFQGYYYSSHHANEGRRPGVWRYTCWLAPLLVASSGHPFTRIIPTYLSSFSRPIPLEVQHVLNSNPHYTRSYTRSSTRAEIQGNEYADLSCFTSDTLHQSPSSCLFCCISSVYFDASFFREIKKWKQKYAWNEDFYVIFLKV